MQETTLHPGGQFLAWWALPSLGGGPRNAPQPAILSLPAACGQGRGPAVMDTATPSGTPASECGAQSQDPALTTATSSLLGPLAHLNSGPGACQLVINSAQKGTCGSFSGWQMLQPM